VSDRARHYDINCGQRHRCSLSGEGTTRTRGTKESEQRQHIPWPETKQPRSIPLVRRSSSARHPGPTKLRYPENNNEADLGKLGETGSAGWTRKRCATSRNDLFPSRKMCGRSQFAFSCFSRFHLRFLMLRECLILSKPRLRNTVSTILQNRLESLLRLPLNSLFLSHKSLASCRVSFPTISDAIEVAESHTGGAVLGASLCGTSPIKQRGTIFAPVKSSSDLDRV
jgi:hypothetical protein